MLDDNIIIYIILPKKLKKFLEIMSGVVTGGVAGGNYRGPLTQGPSNS